MASLCPRLVELCRTSSQALSWWSMIATASACWAGKGAAWPTTYGLTDRVDLICGSFSKSLASTGGFIAADRATVEYLRSSSQQIIFSAAITPSAAAAALASLRVMQREPEHPGKRLWENTRYLQGILRRARPGLLGAARPRRCPIVIGDKEKTVFHLEIAPGAGILHGDVDVARRAGAGKDLIRTAVSALHTKEILDRFGDALKTAIKKANYKPPGLKAA